MVRWWLVVGVLLGCDDGGPAGRADGEAPLADAARLDAARDAAARDAAPRDAAQLDGALPDAGRPDAERDATVLDAAADAAPRADAARDAAPADAGPDACVPTCGPSVCGPDGCGQTCGACGPEAPLCEGGQCVGPPPVIIAELVPGNTRGLRDDLGRTSDWLELQNRSRQPVDLTGWYLTDDPADLTQWPVPAVVLAPGEARVVFATGAGADVALPGALYAPFRLQAGGESLLLVWRDGVTVVDAYTPFPAVPDDVAYGVSQTVEVIPLVAQGALAAWRVPVGPDEAWQGVDFDDADWARGPTGLGYDHLGGPPPPEDQLELAAHHPAGQSSTLGGFSADLAVNGNFDDFTHTFRDDQSAAWWVDLEQTWWIDRVVLHNRRGCCGSRLRDITVHVLDAMGEEVYASDLLNPENSLGDPATIEVPIGGVEGRTVRVERTPDLDLSGTNGQGNDDEPTVLSLGEVQVWGGADRIGARVATDVEAAMYGINASLQARLAFALDDPAGVDTLTLVVQTDAGFVVWLNGERVADRRAPAELHGDSAATGEAEVAVERVEVNLSNFLPLLRPGRNVLALQGLNGRADDDDFVLLPTLTARRIRDGERRFFEVPTPGAPNDQPGVAGFVAPVVFGTPSGLQAAPFQLTLSSATPEAEIRYTTDGRAPSDEVGAVYVGPLAIDHTTVVRAVATRPDYKPAPRTAGSWIFAADVAAQDVAATLAAGFPPLWGATEPDYGMDPRVIGPGAPYADRFAESLAAVPTLSITTDLDGVFGPNGIYTRSDQAGVAWERAVSAEWVAPGEPGFQVECGLRIQGGAFRSHGLTKKHSLRLLFKNAYGPGSLRYSMFGDAGPRSFDTLTLRANSNDGWQWSGAGARPLFIRDAFARATRRAMGGEASRGRFAHLYLNGIYWGVYEVVERPDAAFSATHFGGERDDWDGINSGASVDGDLAAWNALLAAAGVGFADAAAYDAVRGAGEGPQQIDVADYADYMLTNLYVGNTDWPRKNYYVGRDRARGVGFKFYMWDAEWSMGIQSELGTDRTGVGEGVAVPWAALKQNAEFRLLVADRAHRHLFGGGALFVDPAAPAWDPEHPEHNVPAARFMALADQVEAALVAESARWGDQHAAEPFTPDAHWRVERDRLLASYLPQRSGVFLDQLRAAGLYPVLRGPLFEQRDGQLPLGHDLVVDAEGERLYYTLDGTDPRLPGGDVAPEAVEGVPGEAIPLGQRPAAVRVRARSWQAGTWSAIEEGTFLLVP